MRFSRSRGRTAALTAGALAIVLRVAASTQPQAIPRSVRDGIYTSAQADRGEAVYGEKCAGCHVARMWGADWTEKSLGDIYDIIGGYMPADDPGTLSPKQTRDIIAYLLRTNELPPGITELPESIEALRAIRIESAR